MSIREHVKQLVLLRRDMHEGHIDPTDDEEPFSQRKMFEGANPIGQVWKMY
jgi:hypothetical protein